MGRCLKTAPWNNSDLGMTLEIAKVQTGITSSILAFMGQMNYPWASTQSLDANKVVIYRNQITYLEVMEV